MVYSSFLRAKYTISTWNRYSKVRFKHKIQGMEFIFSTVRFKQEHIFLFHFILFYLFMYLFIYLFTYLFIYLFIYLLIYLFTYLFIVLTRMCTHTHVRLDGNGEK